jgi:hypothetical protein
MNAKRRAAIVGLAGLILVAGVVAPAVSQSRIPIGERVADVNGVRLHYQVASKGDLVILLHGYAETSHMCG